MAAYAIQFRRGTTLEHSAFTGEVGEVTVDTDKNTLIVHDGTTPGGHQIALYSDISGAPSSGSSSTPGGASTTVSDTAPTSPSNGDFWYNSSTLGLFIYYNDGSSSQWVQVSGGVSTGETVISSDSQPTGVDAGDFWLDTTTLDLFVYYVDNSNNGSWVQVSGGGGSTATIAEGDSSVEVIDTGLNGTIALKTENTVRWNIQSTGHLIPNGNQLYDIGEPENKIRDLYMSTATIHTDGGNISTTDGVMTFGGEPVILLSHLKDLINESESFDDFKNNISKM